MGRPVIALAIILGALMVLVPTLALIVVDEPDNALVYGMFTGFVWLLLVGALLT